MGKMKIGSALAALCLLAVTQMAEAKCKVWLEDPSSSKSWKELQHSLLKNRIEIDLGRITGDRRPSFLSSMELQSVLIRDLIWQFEKTTPCFRAQRNNNALDAANAYARYRADAIEGAVKAAERASDYGLDPFS
ncbi:MULTISPECIES: hypothetical protein [Polaromonas]|uniref:Uncharacterized protein n=1 Tax=Polaromonas aquatica TaxID=332657 RepID=A0ABW1U160_9BURK